MSDDLPDPMTPADCDLRGMPFMPLDVVRLGDSDLVALSTGEEFKAAVLLWGKAWLQVPAASLPDDPRILAHLSGAGARWKKVAAMALRGFVTCSDGRLYHPVIAEKAREAWSFRVRQRERSAKANAVRWASPKESPPSSPRGSPDDPKGQGQGQGQKTETASPSGTTPLSSTATGAERARRGTRLPPDWQPNLEDRASAESVGLDPTRIAEAFRDYWHAKAGKDAVKLDWSATWRGWCRREAERGGTGTSHRAQSISKADQRRDFVLDLMRGEGADRPVPPRYDFDGEVPS